MQESIRRKLDGIVERHEELAALLADRRSDAQTMFWNTYNSTPLSVDTRKPEDVTGIPESFLSYFD